MEGGIFPCSSESRDDCLRKIGGSEGLLTEKLFFMDADLLDFLRVCPTEVDLLDLLRGVCLTEADFLRVCRMVRYGQLALLLLAL